MIAVIAEQYPIPDEYRPNLWFTAVAKIMWPFLWTSFKLQNAKIIIRKALDGDPWARTRLRYHLRRLLRMKGKPK